MSIHTLVGASLEILNDHFADQAEVADNLLIFHRHAPFIKEERRQEIRKIERAAQNFFKHADKDLQQGVTSFEFQTNINDFFIFGAIQALIALSKRTGIDFTDAEEFRLFLAWFVQRYPDCCDLQEMKKVLGDKPPITESEGDLLKNEFKTLLSLPRYKHS